MTFCHLEMRTDAKGCHALKISSCSAMHYTAAIKKPDVGHTKKTTIYQPINPRGWCAVALRLKILGQHCALDQDT